ncbi:MAG: T9SS type A sorting domain-containing protein [Bacteroidia bacterium]|nr:T9SS type A sorting domain-containing protein [Bacteroidia bacterium]
MKTIKLIIYIILLPSISLAQTWQWAKGIGGLNYDAGGILIAGNGDTYLSGEFGGQCFFQTDTLWTWPNAHGLFVSKLDPLGNEVWIKQIGGTSVSGSQEIIFIAAIDELNNCIYITGRFDGTISMDGHAVTSVNSDYYLAKLDMNGTCQWIIKAGSSGIDDRTMEAFLDDNGDVYWTATLTNNGTLDTITLQKGEFLAKISASGNIIWAKDEFVDIDPILEIRNNRMYFCGTTRNDTCIVDTMTITNANAVDVIVGEINFNGDVQWVKLFDSPANAYCKSIEIDSQGDLYLSGTFQNTLTVGSQQLIAQGFQEGFLIKLDANGNLLWLKQSYSGITTGWTSFNGITTNDDGTSYLIGYFSGSTQIGSFNLSTGNSEDVFVTRIDKNGNWLGIDNFGPGRGFGVQEDNTGNFYISGIFQNTMNIGSTSLTSAGGFDIFIAKCSAITGIGGNERSLQSQLSIYANPNKGSFRIKIPQEIVSYEDATLLVFDQQGREITRFAFSNTNDDTPVFDVDKAGPGVYMVQLVQGTKSYWGKMVVE